MKSVFTFFVSVFLLAFASAQSPITLEVGDIPIPFETFNYDNILSGGPSSPKLSDRNWNYSTFFGNDPFSVTYIKEEDPFYINFGVDNYVLGFKSLTPMLGYNIFNELDFNDEAVDDIGIYIDEQVYSLQAFTGNAADNITFPLQGYVVENAPRRIMQFPFSDQSSWSSTSYRVNNFTLSVSAFGLNKTPSQHVYYTFREDTIVGFGKLRVYTPDGPSIAYDVLIDKVLQYNVDSFYVGGAPAPSVLTNAFGIRQGQITDQIRQYNFYRKGSFSYLMRFNYGNDDTYTKLQSVFVNKDDLLAETSSTLDDENGSYSTVLFPNPVTANEINLVVLGKEIQNINYSLTNISGKEVMSARQQYINNNTITLTLDNDLKQGIYILQFTDAENKIIATEKLSVLK
jgi:hypothetical protein